jgi:hypothetical protein
MKEAGQTAEKAENAAGGCEDHELAAELAEKEKKPSGFANILDANDARLAFVTTLTAGSLLKGALDIYGTTSRLLILYPFIAVVILAVFLAQRLKRKS